MNGNAHTQGAGRFSAGRLRPARADERVYRINNWGVRIGAPLIAIVVTIASIQQGGGGLVLIPIVVGFGAWWVYAAEMIGLYVTDSGIECRMGKRKNSFRYAWSDVDHFELGDVGAQLAVLIQLRDGTRRMLPCTRVWAFMRGSDERLQQQLTRELDAARGRASQSVDSRSLLG